MEASRSQLVSGRVRSGLVGSSGSAGGQGVEHVGVGHDAPARAAAPRPEAAREGNKSTSYLCLILLLCLVASSTCVDSW